MDKILQPSLVMQMADAMVSSGLRDAGYRYINIDDGWAVARDDKNQTLIPDPGSGERRNHVYGDRPSDQPNASDTLHTTSVGVMARPGFSALRRTALTGCTRQAQFVGS